ncbi:AN1-type zinc finger protein 2A-like [Asterias rubens]|uniref:AN1-type zinc finger protein 2A-like n=1 Tax=Asterias rubens TaxID=7604 RepID=UPI00145586FE|nr:AN1-type zinc finger protein 2A-like [Asterias rubens]
MEFPTLGNNCFVNTCKQLDFLPMKCDACSGLFCKDHIQYSEHHCDTAYTKDIQVPVCPLCNKPVPSKRGEPPDIKMSQHIDNDCQSDPAKEKRIFANRCSLKGCKQKELVPVMCSSCHQNYCIRHRHTTDHNCQGYDKSGKTVSRQGVAAINRATTSGQKPQETALAHIGRNLDKCWGFSSSPVSLRPPNYNHSWPQTCHWCHT